MIKTLLLAGAAVAFVASQAIAADIVDEPMAFDWSGPYVGLTAGYAWARADGSADAGGDINPEPEGLAEDALNGDVNADGFIGGATLGWNYQIDSFVLGIEGDVSFLDIDDTRESEASETARGRDELKADILATLRLRAGLAFDQTLIYITGGGAYTDAKVKREFEWNFDDPCPETGDGFRRCYKDDADFDWGWTIGAGIEHAFDEHWSLKVEYLYADFGKEDFTTRSLANSDQFIDSSFDLDMHIVRAGLNWRF